MVPCRVKRTVYGARAAVAQRQTVSSAEGHVAKPGKSTFTLRAFWFVPGEIRTEERRVRSLSDWRRAVKPYRRRQSVALYLDPGGADAGGMWAHFTGRRAWVLHLDRMGGDTLEARSTAGIKGVPRMIGFRLDNGQVDQVERERTIPRADAMRALEHFLLHGRTHPELRWSE